MCIDLLHRNVDFDETHHTQEARLDTTTRFGNHSTEPYRLE